MLQRRMLGKRIEMMDLGSVSYFLGMELARFDILLSQQKHVPDLLEETCILRCEPMNSPIELNHRMRIGDDNPRGKER